MRRLLVLTLLGAAVVLLSADPSSACWRRRAHCTAPPPCPVVVYQYPPAAFPYPPAAFPHPSAAPPFAAPSFAPPAAARLVSPKGRVYQILDTGERGPFEEAVVPPSATSAAPEDDFPGKDRKKAKTSVADAPLKKFRDVSSLLATLDPDDDMLEAIPPLSEDRNSDRVEKEKRNVSV